MASGTLYFNDIDAYDLGFDVNMNWRGLVGSSPRGVDVQPILGRAGGFVSAYHLPRAARLVSIPGYFFGSSVGNTGSDWRELQNVLQAGAVRIRTVHDADIEFEGLWSADNVGLRDGSLLSSAWLEGELSFVLADPFGRHVDGPFQVGFDSTARDIPCGTAPCKGRLYIYDATNPTITYQDSGSNTIQTMGLTVTHTVGEDCTIIDLDTRAITLSDAGVESNGYAQFTSGRFFSVSAIDDGNYQNSLWPKLKTSSGYGVFRYEKKYL